MGGNHGAIQGAQMKPVKNWRQSWRWLSMQAMALQGAVAGAWLAVPDDMRQSVPSEWLAACAVVLTLLGVAGRLIDQGGSDA
jgi:hypothetical protein